MYLWCTADKGQALLRWRILRSAAVITGPSGPDLQVQEEGLPGLTALETCNAALLAHAK